MLFYVVMIIISGFFDLINILSSRNFYFNDELCKEQIWLFAGLLIVPMVFSAGSEWIHKYHSLTIIFS